jgi:hypothetical protein
MTTEHDTNRARIKSDTRLANKYELRHREHRYKTFAAEIFVRRGWCVTRISICNFSLFVAIDNVWAGQRNWSVTSAHSCPTSERRRSYQLCLRSVLIHGYHRSMTRRTRRWISRYGNILQFTVQFLPPPRLNLLLSNQRTDIKFLHGRETSLSIR